MAQTSPIPNEEGDIPLIIPSISRPCFTHYRIYGDRSNSKSPPLVCVHGGPGAGGRSQRKLAVLWQRHGIPVGCGESTLLPETNGDESFWQVSLFIDELNNLLDHLGLRDGLGFHLYAASFGGYVACALAATRPPGLQRLVLSSCIPSKELSVQSFQEVKTELPVEHQQAIDECGRTGVFDSPGMKEAFRYVVVHYLFRAVGGPVPQEMLDWAEKWNSESMVKNTMSGPSPFFNRGSMVGFTNVPHLHRITAPTLIFNGEFDTSSRDCAQRVFFEHIPKVRWVSFPGAGHDVLSASPAHLERALKLIGDFLVPPTYN
ncbi:hypothetical protein ANO11243_050240 [Dothideomycetidae sp. 11243]|nr:hypothetical protein ANO11243_050240 [fungal sp. No.11243]